MKQDFRRDPHARLLRAVLGIAGLEAQLAAATSRPWASATFIGATHRLTLRVAGEDAMARAVAIGEQVARHDYAIPSHIVADMVVDGYKVVARPDGAGEAVEIRLAALTIEDW